MNLRIAVFSLGLVAMGFAARGAEESPKPAMSDYLRVQLQDGKLAFIIAGTRADAAPGSVERIVSGEIRNVPGTVTIQNLTGRIFTVAALRTEAEKNFTEVVSLNLNNVRISHTLTKIETVDAITKHTTAESVLLTIPTAGGLGKPVDGELTLRIVEDGKPVVTLAEKSFADLCGKHPDEVRKYVIPLFKALDLQGIFHVGNAEALNAFAAQLGITPEMKTKVEAILLKLDDNSADIRHAAADELNALGPTAVPVTEALDLKAQPLQARIAVKGFLQRMKETQPGDADPLKSVDFLTLCLAVDDPRIPALAKKQLGSVTGKAVDFDEKAPQAERQAAVEKLRLAALAK